MWISKKELNARDNKAYLEGYKDGREMGRFEVLREKNTLSQMRVVLGLESIENKEVEENVRKKSTLVSTEEAVYAIQEFWKLVSEVEENV